MKTKFPGSRMGLGAISSQGDIMDSHFFHEGLRVEANEYLEVMRTTVKPCMDDVTRSWGQEDNYVFQHDSAPAHTSPGPHRSGITGSSHTTSLLTFGLHPSLTAILLTIIFGAFGEEGRLSTLQHQGGAEDCHRHSYDGFIGGWGQENLPGLQRLAGGCDWDEVWSYWVVTKYIPISTVCKNLVTKYWFFLC